MGASCVVDYEGQTTAVGASLLEQDQRAEAIFDQSLDLSCLVAGGLIRDPEMHRDLLACQPLHDTQLVDLLLVVGEGGDDPFHQPGDVRQARRGAGPVLVIVIGVI